MKFVIGGTLTILSWDNPVTAFFRKSKKLRHSLGSPSRSDFVHFYFYEQDSSQPKFLPIAVTIGSVVALLYIVAFGRKSKKLRHSLGRPSRSDFVQFQFVKLA